MKKMAMVAISLIASVSVFAQEYGTSAEWTSFYGKNQQKNDLVVESKPVVRPLQHTKVFSKSPLNMSVNYGLNKFFGFDISMGEKITYGIGFSVYTGKSGVGQGYTTFSWKAFPRDVYEKVTAPNVSIYGIVGYKPIKNLIVQANLGVGTTQNYYNAYDKYGILGNGYYHTTTDAGTSILIGGSVQYVIDNITPYVGYDTFNGIKIGVGYNF